MLEFLRQRERAQLEASKNKEETHTDTANNGGAGSQAQEEAYQLNRDNIMRRELWTDNIVALHNPGYRL